MKSFSGLFKSKVYLLLFLFFAISCLHIMSNKANAAPVYYTFSGEVTYVNDTQGLIATQGLGVGSHVSYTFIVDADLQAYKYRVDGTVEVFSDVQVPSWRADRFYVDYYSGDALLKDGNGWYTDPLSSGYNQFKYAEYNYGDNSWLSGSGINAFVKMNSDDNSLAIQDFEYYFPWETATNIRAENRIRSSINGNESVLVAYLNFSGSSDTPPVPIPGAVLLFGSSLVGIIGIRRRLKK